MTKYKIDDIEIYTISKIENMKWYDYVGLTLAILLLIMAIIINL